MKLFVYGTLKRGYGLNHVLSRSLRIGDYITKQKGFRMTGFWYPFIFRDKTSKFSIKGELYDVDQNDFRTANRIELGAGYKLQEIDNGIVGYVYPNPIDAKSICVVKKTQDNYYEWRNTDDMQNLE